MALTLVTAPAEEVLTVAEAKAHLRVDHADDDALIGSLIVAARLSLEGKDGVLNRAFVTQTWDWTLDGFPCGALWVPLPPLQSVTHIKYVDPDGALQTLDPAKYVVDAASEPGRIAPAYATTWPTTRAVPSAVQVRFVAGYGAAAAVPQPLKTAILGMVADLYENRGGALTREAAPVPTWVRALLAPYRAWTP